MTARSPVPRLSRVATFLFLLVATMTSIVAGAAGSDGTRQQQQQVIPMPVVPVVPVPEPVPEPEPPRTRGFTAEDLVSLDKPGGLAVSPGGNHAVFAISRYDKETGVAKKHLFSIDLSETASREFFPPFEHGKKIKKENMHTDEYSAQDESTSMPLLKRLTDGDAKDDSPCWLDASKIAFLSDRKVGGADSETNAVFWIDATAEIPEEPKILFRPPLPISNLVALTVRPDLALLFFTATVNPSVSTMEGTRRLNDEKKEKAKSGRPQSSARVYDDLFVRHWDTWMESPEVSAEQMFALPISLTSGEPKVGGKEINIMAGTNWITPVGPFGGTEDFAFSRSNLSWTRFGREEGSKSIEGVERVQAIFSSRRPAVGSERAWTTDTSLFLVLLSIARAPSSSDHEITVHTQPLDLTPLNTYASNPSFSPDGTHLAYLESREPGNEADRKRLVVLSLPGFLEASDLESPVKAKLTEPEPSWKRTLTEAWDRSPGSVTWSESGIWMSVEEHGRARAFFVGEPVPLPEGKPDSRTQEDPGVVPLRISLHGKTGPLVGLPSTVIKNERSLADPIRVETETVTVHRAVAFHSTSSRPDDLKLVWMIKRETTTMGSDIKKTVRNERGGRLLTALHKTKLSGISLPRPTDFHFRSHGTRIHGFSFPPFNYTPGSGDWPLAVLIHGGPEGAWEDSWGSRWNYQCWTGAGWWVVVINPRGSTGYGQQFTNAVRRDWGGLPYDDLMKGVDKAIERFPVDPDRVVEAGASYGGFMTNWINGHTDRFRALVCHDGLLNQFMNYYATDELFFPESEFGGTPFSSPAARLRYEEFNPERFVANWKTPTLVAHGEKDYRLGVEQGIGAFQALRRQGVPARLLIFPGGLLLAAGSFHLDFDFC